MIGNGDYLECFGLCHQVKIQVQKHEFVFNCYVLTLKGDDLVLGINGLILLGLLL